MVNVGTNTVRPMDCGMDHPIPTLLANGLIQQTSSKSTAGAGCSWGTLRIPVGRLGNLRKD